MAIDIDFADFEIDRVIEAAAQCPEGLFFHIIGQRFGNSAISRSLAVDASTFMVRSGLYLYEEREPLLYYEFVRDVTDYVSLEADMAGATEHKRSWHVPQDNAFMTAANMILDEGIIEEPRTVALGLIRDGLRFCELLASADYCRFLGGVRWLLKMELQRAKQFPKLNTNAV